MNFLALLSNSKTPFLQRNPLTSDSEKQMPGGHHYRAFAYSRHSLFAENSALQVAGQNKLPQECGHFLGLLDASVGTDAWMLVGCQCICLKD